jgi:predicted DNA-binding antitoxin AbrB/MazE fold protein
MADLLPQGDSFIAQYFICQILKPLTREHSTESANIARRSLPLHIHTFRCHPAKIVSEEMTRLKCKSVPYPPYSPDLAIADFCLFGVLKQKLQRIDLSDGEKLKTEILTIFRGNSSDELKSDSITGSKDASELSQMQGIIIHHSHESSIYFLSALLIFGPSKNSFWNLSLRARSAQEHIR